MTTTETGTQAIWRRIDPIYRSILEHPFLRGVQDGTLPRETFARYLVQDSLYLRQYARSLALCGIRGRDIATLEMFVTHAGVAVATERALHDSILRDLGIDPTDIDDAEMSPVCMAYTSFTKQAAAVGERHEGLASVLPCYWIYWEVGKELIGAGSPDPLYQRWIDTYADEEFAIGVRDAIAACDVVAEGLSARELDSMVWHAQIAARYEWLFWDAAYRDERWPDIGA